MDFHPDDWKDVFVYLIVGIPAIIAAVGVVLNARNQRASHKSQTETADAVLEEVKNDHTTNLRDDIDGLFDAMRLITEMKDHNSSSLRELRGELREGFREIHVDISGVREELRMERLERIDGDRRGLARIREAENL